MDSHKVLGVPFDASHDEIKVAYRRLSLRHHPDRNPDDPNANVRFQDISTAFSELNERFKKPEEATPTLSFADIFRQVSEDIECDPNPQFHPDMVKDLEVRTPQSETSLYAAKISDDLDYVRVHSIDEYIDALGNDKQKQQLQFWFSGVSEDQIAVTGGFARHFLEKTRTSKSSLVDVVKAVLPHTSDLSFIRQISDYMDSARTLGNLPLVDWITSIPDNLTLTESASVLRLVKTSRVVHPPQLKLKQVTPLFEELSEGEYSHLHTSIETVRKIESNPYTKIYLTTPLQLADFVKTVDEATKDFSQSNITKFVETVGLGCTRYRNNRFSSAIPEWEEAFKYLPTFIEHRSAFVRAMGAVGQLRQSGKNTETPPDAPLLVSVETAAYAANYLVREMDANESRITEFEELLKGWRESMYFKRVKRKGYKKYSQLEGFTYSGLEQIQKGRIDPIRQPKYVLKEDIDFIFGNYLTSSRRCG
jgi:hypothetical protein